MSATLQERKIDAHFDRLDLDGNGYIERADYKESVRRILGEFSVSEHSPKGAALVREFLNLWERMRARMDADGDGRVSREEFCSAVMRSLGQPGGFAKELGPVSTAVGAVCDGDDDGFLSRAEFERLFRIVGATTTGISGAFEHADLDGDGRISRDELTHVIEEFYTSADPQAAGSLLVNA